MTRLFTPVQRLMGRLRYTSKFLLMSAVFGLPLLYLASGVLLHQYAALQDAQRLQDSVAQLRGMTHLTQGVERLRNLSMLRLGLPDLTHMPIYAEQLVQVDRQLEQFRLQQPERSLLIDLDHFKQVNDTYGHQAGDAVLRQTAERFHAVFQRKTDVVARYGGEEFAIILADVGEARARQLAEQVRQQIAATPMDLGHQAIDVTASIGLAWCRPTSQYTAHDLVADADMALYEAKRLGRNRVCLHHTLCESGA